MPTTSSARSLYQLDSSARASRQEVGYRRLVGKALTTTSGSCPQIPCLQTNRCEATLRATPRGLIVKRLSIHAVATQDNNAVLFYWDRFQSSSNPLHSQVYPGGPEVVSAHLGTPATDAPLAAGLSEGDSLEW